MAEEGSEIKYDFVPKKRNFEKEVKDAEITFQEVVGDDHPLNESLSEKEKDGEEEEVKVVITAKLSSSVDPLSSDPLSGGDPLSSPSSSSAGAENVKSGSVMSTSIGMGVFSSISQAKQSTYHGGLLSLSFFNSFSLLIDGLFSGFNCVWHQYFPEPILVYIWYLGFGWC